MTFANWMSLIGTLIGVITSVMVALAGLSTKLPPPAPGVESGAYFWFYVLVNFAALNVGEAKNKNAPPSPPAPPPLG